MSVCSWDDLSYDLSINPEEVDEQFVLVGLTCGQLHVDRRLQLNRGCQLKMSRVWIQAKVQKVIITAVYNWNFILCFSSLKILLSLCSNNCQQEHTLYMPEVVQAHCYVGCSSYWAFCSTQLKMFQSEDLSHIKMEQNSRIKQWVWKYQLAVVHMCLECVQDGVVEVQERELNGHNIM